MKRRPSSRRALWCTVFTLVGVVSQTVPAQQPVPVAVILEIEPPVFLRTGTKNVEIRLDKARDIGRALVAGQAIRTEGKGKARIGLIGEIREVTPSLGRLEVRPPSPRSEQEKKARAALNEYGRPAGSRSLAVPVYSPAPNGVVRSSSLNVRWTPDPTSRHVDLEITSSGRRVWSATGVENARGQLPSDQTLVLREAIRASVERGGTQDFTLTLKQAEQTVVSFRVLSSADESSLDGRLSGFKTGDQIFDAILRAGTLKLEGLHNEAADALESALALSPTSDALLRAALTAQEHIGHVTRARELTALLGPDRR